MSERPFCRDPHVKGKDYSCRVATPSWNCVVTLVDGVVADFEYRAIIAIEQRSMLRPSAWRGAPHLIPFASARVVSISHARISQVLF